MSITSWLAWSNQPRSLYSALICSKTTAFCLTDELCSEAARSLARSPSHINQHANQNIFEIDGQQSVTKTIIWLLLFLLGQFWSSIVVDFLFCVFAYWSERSARTLFQTSWLSMVHWRTIPTHLDQTWLAVTSKLRLYQPSHWVIV